MGRADRLADPGEQATEPARGPMDSGRGGGDRAHRRFLGLGGSAAVCDTDPTEERSGAPRRRTTQPVVDRETIKPLLEQLDARAKRILLLRFFRNMTQSQIAEELGISQMHVSRLLSRTLADLRKALEERSSDPV